MELENRICIQCGKDFITKDNRQINCSYPCNRKSYNDRRNKWRKEHPIEYKKEREDWEKKVHSDKILLQKRRDVQYKHSQKISGKFTKYKSGAKQRGLNFDLTKEEFESFWQKPCTYCGGEVRTIGLDRIDNSMGYSINNVLSCCIICNNMKKVLSKDFFISHCKKIAEFNGSTGV